MKSFFRYCCFLIACLFTTGHTAFAYETASAEIIAVFPKNFPPQFHLSPEGKPFGFAIEVMDEVAHRAGLKIKYKPVENWLDVFELIRKGEADIVPNMGITPERAELMLFSSPYERFSIRIFVRKNNRDISDLADLAGKRVSTTVTNVANQLADGIKFISYPDASKSVTALLEGNVDAIILPDIVVHRLASRSYQGDQLKAVGEPLKVIQRAIAVVKDKPELLSSIESVMDDYLSSDEFKDTKESWIKEPKPALTLKQLMKLDLALLGLVCLIIGVTLFRKLGKQKESLSLFETNIGFRVLSLITILFVATLLTTAISLWFLYDTAFEGQKARLTNIAQSRARIIESMARYDLSNSHKLGLNANETLDATLSQIREAHKNFSGFGHTGEFTFAEKANNNIVFFLRQRHSDTVKPNDIPWDSAHAEPMRRALSGHSGTLVGLDYRGTKVLAAHEPVDVLNAGIVAKIDLDEIRLPYIRAGLIVFGIALSILAIGVLLLFLLTAPILNTLAQAYARLKAIIDHSPNLIVITDPGGNTVLASPIAEELSSELPKQGESNVLHRDGTMHTYLTQDFPLQTDTKASFGTCQISTDITDRVISEIELKQQEQNLRTIVENMPIMLYALDEEGQLIAWNQECERITGYSSVEMLRNKDALRLLFPDSEYRKSVLAEYFTSGDHRKWVLKLTAKDGSIRIVEWSNVSNRYPIPGWSLWCIGEDVTARKQAVEKLKQFELAFQSTSEGMLITDLKGNIVTVNNAFERITGYTTADVQGQNPRILQSGRHDNDFYARLWNSLKSKGEWRGEIWNRRKNGVTYPEWLNISTVYKSDKTPSHYVAVFSDITTIKQSQDQLLYLAHHDPLTHLPNRLLFNDRLDHSLKQAHRERNMVALFALDLDRFKNINDSLGHPAGDSVLKEAAQRLRKLTRENDTVARMGGDEFTIIADGINNFHSVATMAEKIVRGMAHNYNLDNQEVMTSVSLGIAVYPQDGNTTSDLLKNADAALYKAKEHGRNTFHFYTEDLSKSAFEKLVMENQIMRGLEHDEFVLFYQPQYEINSNRLVSAEALVRWQHPEFGLLSPDRFIPLAEENGLIIPLGDWILENACKQAKTWLDNGHKFDRIAVNLAGKQIERPDLVQNVKTALSRSGLEANKLELEVTEGFIMSDVKDTIPVLEELSNLGITIAIDDFGTGYSSLAYLKRLPIRTLKIDQSFVRNLPHDEEDAAISRAVIALGHSLGMDIIAEGVENQNQWNFLQTEGCEIMQGYLKGKPVNPQQFEADHLHSLSSK